MGGGGVQPLTPRLKASSCRNNSCPAGFAWVYAVGHTGLGFRPSGNLLFAVSREEGGGQINPLLPLCQFPRLKDSKEVTTTFPKCWEVSIVGKRETASS